MLRVGNLSSYGWQKLIFQRTYFSINYPMPSTPRKIAPPHGASASPSASPSSSSSSSPSSSPSATPSASPRSSLELPSVLRSSLFFSSFLLFFFSFPPRITNTYTPHPHPTHNHTPAAQLPPTRHVCLHERACRVPPRQGDVRAWLADDDDRIPHALPPPLRDRPPPTSWISCVKSTTFSSAPSRMTVWRIPCN